MNTFLQLSKALMIIALCIGGVEFVKMYRNGEINKIYSQEQEQTPQAVIKNAAFTNDPVSIDETKNNILQKKEVVEERDGSSDRVLLEVDTRLLSLKSFSRAAPGRSYEEEVVLDTLSANPVVVMSDSSEFKSNVLPDSSLAGHN